jgi:probable O-glycosylation ligase (exosortase A-associated)
VRAARRGELGRIVVLRLFIVLATVMVGTFASLGSAFYALLFYLWNAYFRPEQWVWNDLVQQLNLSLVISGMLLVRTMFSPERFTLNTRLAVVGLLFLQAFISTMASDSFDWSMHYWIDFAKVLVVTYLIVVLVTDVSRLRLALMVIALSLGFEGAKQGLIGLLLHPGTRNLNEHPVLGDNNGVAQGMMMLVPIFALLAQTTARRWEQYLHRFLLVGALARGITTYSRGGMLAATAIGLMTISRSKHRVRMLIVSVVVAAATLSLMPQSFWDRMDTLTNAPEEQDDSAKGRLHFWNVALQMVADRPLTGVGLNSFSKAYDKYDFSDGFYGRQRAVHSTWFGILAELGIPGTSLFVLTIVLAFAGCRRVRKAPPGNPDVDALRPYAIALEMSLVAYLIGGTFLNGQYSELFWHMIGFSIALHVLSREPVHACVSLTPPQPSLALASAGR